MSDMKLIFENWDKFINEQLDACPEQPVDIDTFLSGIELAMMEPEVQKSTIERLKRQGQNVQKLNSIVTIGGLVAGVPAVAASAPVSLGAALVGVFANVINDVQQKNTSAKTNNLLRLLCIDSALLATIDNDIESSYLQNSDIQQEIEDYIKAARENDRPDPLPDFTAHLVNWLNTDANSPYAQQGTPGLDTDIVVRK